MSEAEAEVLEVEVEQAIARANFDRAVATNQYFSVVDAQSDASEWTAEYWDPDHTVPLEAPIIFGKVLIQVRKFSDESDWDEEGGGEETEFSIFIGEENKSTTLIQFIDGLLSFTGPLAKKREIGGNIYQIKEASNGVFYLFMGD